MKLPALVLLASLAMPAGALAHGEVDHGDRAPSGLAKGARAASAPQGAPVCTTPNPAGHPDNVENPYRVRLAYAYRSGQADRSQVWGPMIGQAAQMVNRHLARSSGYRKGLRFDLTSACGTPQLDLSVVELAVSGADAHEIFVSARRQMKPYRKDGENLMVFIDGTEHDGVNGYGELRMPGGRHGGYFSAGFLSELYVKQIAWVMLHELMHNMGAVSTQSPNATPGSHTLEGDDLLQQPDPGMDRSLLKTRCERRADLALATLDCNGDDYFNPSPVPGTPMADPEFNTFFSPLMASCAEAGCQAEQVEGVKITSLRQTARRALRVTLSGPSAGESSAALEVRRRGTRKSSLYEAYECSGSCSLSPDRRGRARVIVSSGSVRVASRWISVR